VRFRSSPPGACTRPWGESGSRRLVSVKGAPERVLDLCTSWRSPDGDVPLDRQHRRRVEALTERLARRGFRVLAVAQRSDPLPETPVNGRRAAAHPVPDPVPGNLQLLGLLALADEARGDGRSRHRRSGQGGGLRCG